MRCCGQEYPYLEEVILVGSTGDSTWTALADVDDPRLVVLEQSLCRGRGTRQRSGTRGSGKPPVT